MTFLVVKQTVFQQITIIYSQGLFIKTQENLLNFMIIKMIQVPIL